MLKPPSLSRRQFVGTAAAAAGAALLPTTLLSVPQDPVVNAVEKDGKVISLEKIPWKVRPFPMPQVRLGEAPFKQAIEADLRYLNLLPTDRLLHSFRVTAGLPSSAEPLGGWEKPDCEVRGHFAGGHYLSACALMYASTGDDAIKARGDLMVSELAKCQDALKTGYLGAYPADFYDRLREGIAVWAPFYTLHKIMAGHLDMYVHCGNQQALQTVEGIARWVQGWTNPLSEQHMQRVLGVEHGGMIEVLCNLYAVSGNVQYLELSRRFEHKQFFDPLAARRDELKGLHANTNIPKVTGAARAYELTGEHRLRDITDFFWREVVSERTYCTGGTSDHEHWLTEPGKLSTQLSKETEECCCGYNMLKLTRHVFGWTADPRAMDYYERTLFNSRLGTINPEDGMMMYFLPLASGYWKFFNSPYNSFWCCTGTGVEEYAKLADTIYFHDDHGIYINLFIASEVNWPEKGIRVTQQTNFPEEQGTTLLVQAKRPVEMSLNIRIPYWVARGGQVKLNGAMLPTFASPSSYLTLNRVWQDGDKVEVSLPMELRVAPMPDDESIQAIMYGPLVLAGRLGTANLTKDMMYGGYSPAPQGDPISAPTIAANPRDPTGWLEPVGNERLRFRAANQSRSIELIPLYKLFGERYAVYWNVRNRGI